MILDQQQITFINENEWVVFATADMNAAPRAAVVMPSRVDAGRIIISDVQMTQSAENVKANPRVFVSSYKGDTQIKISGAAEYRDSGSLFDEIKEFEKTRDVDVKGIIIVTIEHIEQTDG
ncbi:MAG: pyridoxamine 5'-phosphate oxidase family protein [Alphaproteobacteria bacterium]|nr:pyridoxamine 5'-phosphate oxidase family protein [Alphaproteobacteria bacterium]MCL2758211.1 pyridoxamine 5'-phosphate oxidase family protein [Alphaproteobacteria bacterium]